MGEMLGSFRGRFARTASVMSSCNNVEFKVRLNFPLCFFNVLFSVVEFVVESPLFHPGARLV